MANVRRELLADYLTATVGPETSREAMVILEEVFQAVDSGSLPQARLEIVNASDESNLVNGLRAELDRLQAFEAMQDTSDLRVCGAILADTDRLRKEPDLRGGDPYEGTIIEMTRENDSGDPALRAVIRESIGDAMFQVVMDSPREQEESMAIFRNMHAAVRAYLIFALEGRHQKMIRMARLLHILPKAVPVAKTSDGEIVLRTGDALFGEVFPAETRRPAPRARPRDSDAGALPVATGTLIERRERDEIARLLGDEIVKFQDEILDGSRPLVPLPLPRGD